jgi:hypothetical protein
MSHDIIVKQHGGKIDVETELARPIRESAVFWSD